MSALRRPLQNQLCAKPTRSLNAFYASLKSPKNSLGLGSRRFTSEARRQADFTHVVIGGGAVGLAIARRLAGREGTSTLLVERNGGVGMETSSRNSEVG